MLSGHGGAVRLLATAVFACLALAAPAQALTPTITEFGFTSGSTSPAGITAGPGGNLWFTDNGSTPAVGVMTTGGLFHEYTSGLNSGSSPFSIAAGPDGNVWFSDPGATNAIGRATPSGTITEFGGLGLSSNPAGIAAGPDGNLWAADSGASAIEQITPSGGITKFTKGLLPNSKPNGITAGADGNLWFTDDRLGGAIGRITPSGTITEFTGLNPGSKPAWIAAGPDGNLWFTDDGTTKAIGRITPSGLVDEFSTGLPVGSDPRGIASGPDGALWFADRGTTPAIGRITTSGDISEFTAGLTATTKPTIVTLGPDGDIWFTDPGSPPAIGRITTPPTASTVSAMATGSSTAAVFGVANGHAQSTHFKIEYGVVGGSTRLTSGHSLGTASGNVHFAGKLSHLRPSTTYQARVVVWNPTDTVYGAFLTFTTRPPKDSISGLRISPKTLFAAAHGPTIVPARRRAGALVSYRGTQPATTTFTVQELQLGRRQGGSCVKPTRRNRFARLCTHWVGVGSFRHLDVAGLNRFHFSGRLHNRKLPVGNYRLRVVPRSAGGVGRTRYVKFAVRLQPKAKPKPKPHK